MERKIEINDEYVIWKIESEEKTHYLLSICYENNYRYYETLERLKEDLKCDLPLLRRQFHYYENLDKNSYEYKRYLHSKDTPTGSDIEPWMLEDQEEE